MQTQFDLIVIGAGSGGIAASRRAASYGAKVLLIESTRIGGTCVLRGCIPKKLLMYAAGFTHAMQEAGAFGWTGVSAQFKMDRWLQAKDQELNRLEAVYQQMIADAGVQLLMGQARIAGQRSVEVNGRIFHADRILLATGGTPAQSAIPGLENAWTSDDILNLPVLPESLLVIGAGYIAVEFASILASLGVSVSMAYRAKLPLRGFDEELRCLAAQSLQNRGIRLEPGSQMESLVQTAEGFTLQRTNAQPLRARAVLNATGRRPHARNLGLEGIGVQLDPEGAISVDADSRTTAPTVWAIGDVTNRINLTPVAIAEGRAFADTEFGHQPSQVEHRNVASAVFCDPPIASVGLTEAQAAARGPTDVYTSQFRTMKTAFAGGQERTFMKLVVDSRSDRVLGIHMLGADAPEILQGLAITLSAGATKTDFNRTMALHPSSAEEFVLLRTPVRKHP